MLSYTILCFVNEQATLVLPSKSWYLLHEIFEVLNYISGRRRGSYQAFKLRCRILRVTMGTSQYSPCSPRLHRLQRKQGRKPTNSTDDREQV